MTTPLHINLPASMKKWAEDQAVERGYSTTDAFFLEMLRKEKELAAREKVDRILLGAIHSGEPTPVDRADWDRIRAMCRESAKVRRRK